MRRKLCGLLLIYLEIFFLIAKANALQFPDTPAGREKEAKFRDEIGKLWEQYEGRFPLNRTSIAATTFGNKTSNIIGKLLESHRDGRPIYIFQGIRFASAERFAIPKELENDGQYWDEELPALHIKPQCPQSRDDPLPIYESEDCLYLNVYTETHPDDIEEPLPVMVFIYGGSFTSGASYYYLPHKLVQHDVVLVTINYRLSALGFFTLNNDEAPGNYALYDQREALRWVNKHISDFGGDPSRVTVFGESAGSVSTSYMTLVADEGTIHGAISESGTTAEPWSIDEDPMYATYYVANHVDCLTEEKNEINMTCMRTVAPGDLIRATKDLVHADRKIGLMGFRGCSPTIQPPETLMDPILEKRPEQIYADGEALDIPYMLGCNKQEGSYPLHIILHDFLEQNDLFDNTTFMREETIFYTLKAMGVVDYSHGLSNTMYRLYCPGIDLSDFNAAAPCLVDLMGALFLRGGMWKVANEHARFTTHGTYPYNFDYSDGPTMQGWLLHFDPPFDPGVGHADDLPFVFPMPVLMNHAHDREVEAKMTLMWTNFAKYGDPTPDSDETWKDYNITKWKSYEFDDNYFLLIRNETTLQKEFPLRWTITMDELRANGEQITLEPPIIEELNFIDLKDTSDDDNDYFNDDISELEDKRDNYFITMIIFMSLFIFTFGVDVILYMRLTKQKPGLPRKSSSDFSKMTNNI